SFARTRATRSRTSAAAPSGSRSSRKRTVIWLNSEREIDVSTSTPSMPAIESSSGLVTCVSMMSGEAPRYFVETVTVGSSIFGYSRTWSLEYETRPSRTMTSDSTVANTGLRMQVSESRTSAALSRRLDDAHLGRLARELRLPGGDDLLAAAQAVDDLDPAVAAQPGAHPHADRLAFVDPVDELLLP